MALRDGSLGKLNAFPRSEEHLMKKTNTGATVTIIGMLLLATLFLHELAYQLSTRTVHEMSVDTKRGEKLPIKFNITFPALPCRVLSLDTMDITGKYEVDLDTNIWKIRINKDGYIIGSEFVSDPVEGDHQSEDDKLSAQVKLHDELHHSPHGDDEHEHNYGPRPIGDTEKVIKEIKTALKNHEGCRVFGVLDVERVAGNFHVSMHGLTIFVAEQVYETVTEVNVSHVIHTLSFGPEYPGIQNPLDGTSRILHEESGTFKYFMKIVPIEYRFLGGLVMPTNQFSVTESFMSSKVYDRIYRPGMPSKVHDRNWPAVFFFYDLSPISVTIREERHHFVHFITRLCAVIGGTFAVTGVLDRWIHALVQFALPS